VTGTFTSSFSWLQSDASEDAPTTAAAAIENELGAQNHTSHNSRNNDRTGTVRRPVIANKSMWRLLYLFLLFIRVYFALSPSYLHPDEIFQGPEVIAGRLQTRKMRIDADMASRIPFPVSESPNMGMDDRSAYPQRLPIMACLRATDGLVEVDVGARRARPC
jgi:hypothetical protein